jgi:hypothetical protein
MRFGNGRINDHARVQKVLNVWRDEDHSEQEQGEHTHTMLQEQDVPSTGAAA